MAEPAEEFLTPADLSRELGVSQKRVRDFLRSKYGKLVAPATRWELGGDRAAAVRAHFRASSQRA